MIEIRAGDGRFEAAVRKLSNEFRRSGMHTELRLKQHHLTRKQKRRIKDSLSLKRNLKLVKKIQEAVQRDERQGRRRIPASMRRKNESKALR